MLRHCHEPLTGRCRPKAGTDMRRATNWSAAGAGIQNFKMLARCLTLVPAVDRQLCRRVFNQKGTRTRPSVGYNWQLSGRHCSIWSRVIHAIASTSISVSRRAALGGTATVVFATNPVLNSISSRTKLTPIGRWRSLERCREVLPQRRCTTQAGSGRHGFNGAVRSH